MTLFGALFAPVPTSPGVRIAELFDASQSTNASGVKVTETSSLGMPAVFRAVNLIAGTIASLPLHPYKADGTGRQRVTTGPAASFLDNPHPDLTPFELWEILCSHMLLWGNAYAAKVNNGTRIASLWPIHPSRVKAGRTSTGQKVYLLDDQQDRVYTDADILHLPAFGYDGVCGVSPVRIAAQGIGLALAAEEYGAKLFGSGSLATGLLQTEQRLSNEDADRLQARWRAKRAGLGSAHETIVLDKGAKFTQLTIPPEDAQFLQSRSFQVSEVARIFGVPPHMLMDTDKSTSWGTGIESQTLGFVIYSLRPWLVRIEQRVTRLLSPEPVYARFALEGLLRGDSATRSAFYTAMWNLGVLSTNDIRALEELSPVEGGDARYRPLNFGTLGTTEPAQGADA